MTKLTHPRRFFSIAILIVLLCLLIVYSTQSKGTVSVVIKTFPEDAQVKIGGNGASSPIRLKPGRYTFIASKEGFSTEYKEVSISRDDSSVVLVLIPQSQEAKAWAAEPENVGKYSQYGDQTAEERGIGLRKKNPILDVLPHSDITAPYILDYNFYPYDSSRVYVTVDYSTPGGRVLALDWLRQQPGINLSELDFVFKDYTNPLTIKGDQ